PERPDLEGPVGALVLGHPVDVRQLLPLPAAIDRGGDLRLVALAEDLDAPRPVARHFVAGDDEAELRQRLQLVLTRQSLVGRDDAPGLPAGQAASMKLSKTFLGPAFSNSMSSLFPSTAR